jgi:hypothetical protein
MFHTFFLCEIFPVLKNKKLQRKYHDTIFPFLLKNLAKWWNLFLPHWNFDFNLVTFSKIIFELFKHVVKMCRDLVLNPSWDANQWHKIINLKNHITIFTWITISISSKETLLNAISLDHFRLSPSQIHLKLFIKSNNLLKLNVTNMEMQQTLKWLV